MATSTNIKYRVHLEVIKLKINKNIDFETKIVWKRSQNKAQTNSVKHSNGYSIFNETLSLEFNMPYNESTQTFLEKKTEIVAVIVHQGKVKSGGYAKYNIADNLNSNPHGVSKVEIPMTQCPDPSSFIEVAFSYERLSDQIENDNQSIMNVSSRDLSLSRIDFHDDKISLELEKMHQLLNKFADIGGQVDRKFKDKSSDSSKMPQILTKLELMTGEKLALEKLVKKLEKQAKEKEAAAEEEDKKSRKQIDELQKQLDKKSKEIKNQREGKKQNVPNYKEMYEAALKEIEQLRSGEVSLRKSMDFRFASNMEDVRQIADLENSSKVEEESNEKIQSLSRQNVELQSQVASMSHKLAQLFNASYQFGGAKLLDFLQTSIGLTQTDQ